MSTLIMVEKLWKVYKEGNKAHVILKDIELKVDEGEQIAIMGPSGSGKTTFLNVVSGLDDATKGKVIIDGNEITAMSIGQRTQFRRKNVGFIFQSFNLIKSMTALENVMLPLLMNGYSRSKAEKKAQELLERVNLLHRKNAYPKNLSGGEKQRVAIARALIHTPKIIFADEPTGSLDRATSAEIIKLIQTLHHEYKQTLMIVTHDPLVAKSCEKIYFLNGTLTEVSKNDI